MAASLSAPARLDAAPYEFGAAARLARELRLHHVTAQVLVRRGFGDPQAARAWLAAEVAHPLAAFTGLTDVVDRILAHVRRGGRITVHGDYDCDGVCSAAILLRALASVGARADWYLPSRTEDGYGLSRATVERLAQRGTGLIVATDCAITAVDEVARARALGVDVVICDHHSPRADGRLPDAPIAHPGLAGYPCPHLCAAGVAHKLAAQLLQATGRDPALADEDLDLVALATVADVVPLVDENRRLVREGLKALATSRRPGIRALLQVARVDPGAVDTQAIGFRLAPRLNAAGRLHRADAALELLLCRDPERARGIAAELDRVNSERKAVEDRIRFEAEALVREQGDRPAYVLAAEGWHPGVVGIVAARIAERHFRPTWLIALDPQTGTGTGSGRSIPAFDLLAGLEAGRAHVLSGGGHRAAAGLTIAAANVEAFRHAFTAHAAATLSAEDLTPRERVDAVAAGGALGLDLAEELQRLAPFGQGNPAVSLLVPAARLSDARGMGEDRHLRCSLQAGGARSRAVAFGCGATLPRVTAGPVDCLVRLERNEYNGLVEPKVVLRRIRRAGGAPIELLGEPADWGAERSGPSEHELHDAAAAWLAAIERELTCALAPQQPPAALPGRGELDGRARGIAATLADLVHSGEPVLALAAHAPRKAQALQRAGLGGFALTSWETVLADPALARGYPHLVAIDPPAYAWAKALVSRGQSGYLHHVHGAHEQQYALQVHRWEWDLRRPLAELYRALRHQSAPLGGAQLADILAGDGAVPRLARMAGRMLRILDELRLVALAPGPILTLRPAPRRTELERSGAFRASIQRLQDGTTSLTTQTLPSAA